jgi:hypothetical protein
VSQRLPTTIPADFASPNVERSLPAVAEHLFGAREQEAEGTIIVHFKVLSADPDERLRVARLLESQLKDQRVGSKGVSFIITNEAIGVESALTSLLPLVSHVTAEVKKTLGIR